MPAHSFVRVLLVAWAALLVTAGTAHAQAGDRVAVVALDIRGGAAAQIKSRTQSSIARNLASHGATLLAHEDVASATRVRADLARCAVPACFKELASLINAQQLLLLSIEASGATYSFELRLLGEDGAELARASDSCPVCNVAEAADQVGVAVAELFRRAAAKRPAMSTVEIVTSPAGARLLIEGTELGVAPYRGPLAPGTYTITASLDGHESAASEIQVGRNAEVQRFELTLLPTMTGGLEDDGRPLRAVKWLGAGTTAALLTTGVVWLVMDGKGTCSGDATCPEVYDTRSLGLASVAVGVGVGAATTWLFLRDRADARRGYAGVAPTRGGAVAAFSLRF